LFYLIIARALNINEVSVMSEVVYAQEVVTGGLETDKSSLSERFNAIAAGLDELDQKAPEVIAELSATRNHKPHGRVDYSNQCSLVM
jgi:hypothetical protein